MPIIEKRSEERFALEIPSNIKATNGRDGESIELITKNVCSGGAFFFTNLSMQMGTAVSVDLVIPIYKSKKMTSDKVMIKVGGTVIRTQINGMVVRFDKKYKIIPIKN